MTWHDVAAASGIAAGTAMVVVVDGKRLALCNTGEGFYLIDDRCTHDGGSLDQGFLDGNEIECSRHGARFDVTTGKARRLPAVRPVRTYPTRVSDGRIEVEVS